MPPRVLITDCPWGDIAPERAILEAAGFDIVAGPASASPAKVVALVRAHDPVAILTYRAPVTAEAIAAPTDLRIIARISADISGIAIDAATARGVLVTNVPDAALPLPDIRRRAATEVAGVLRGAPPVSPCNTPPDCATPLTGGISSDIRLVDTVLGPVVVKSALAELRVAAHWPSDPSRSMIEADALAAIARLVGPQHVPAVLWTDPTRNCFGMARADPRLRNWKADLMAGRVDPATAGATGRLLGRIHTRSSRDADIAARFASQRFFEELRIRPYFERIAERNPDLAPPIHEAIAAMRDAAPKVLVHGDFSPKNILADGADVMVLDCEVAHCGDPRFDVAFLLSHLLLKRARHGADRAALRDAAKTFLSGYAGEGPDIDDARLVRLVGMLMLARLEGDSPVEYRADLDIAAVKRHAVAMIAAPSAAMASILEKLP